MDFFDKLGIRFWFGGAFSSSGGELWYVGGRSEISYVEVDKLSVPEIRGHLADHVVLNDLMRLHWLKPGNELKDGLMLLFDDNSCKVMADNIKAGGIADVYVEEVDVDRDAYEGDDDNDMDRDAYEDSDFGGIEGSDSDSSDVDYHQPLDEDSSGEDEEAEEMRKFAQAVKRDINSRKIGSQLEITSTGALFDEGCSVEPVEEFNSSDEYSYEEDSEGETTRFLSVENRFDINALFHLSSSEETSIMNKYMFSVGQGTFICLRKWDKSCIFGFQIQTLEHTYWNYREQL